MPGGCIGVKDQDQAILFSSQSDQISIRVSNEFTPIIHENENKYGNHHQLDQNTQAFGPNHTLKSNGRPTNPLMILSFNSGRSSSMILPS